MARPGPASGGAAGGSAPRQVAVPPPPPEVYVQTQTARIATCNATLTDGADAEGIGLRRRLPRRGVDAATASAPRFVGVGDSDEIDVVDAGVRDVQTVSVVAGPRATDGSGAVLLSQETCPPLRMAP